MKKDALPTATELFPNGPGSESFQRGRRLTLEFSGEEVPVLQKIQYRPTRAEDPEFWEGQHPTKGFSWSEVPQALALLFVDYLVWDKSGQPERFYFSGSCRGSHAASLGDAIYASGPIQELFAGSPAPGKPPKSQVKLIFNGDNVHGRATVERDRRISVSQNFLPPDCVEIIWLASRKGRLTDLADLKLLSRRLRLSLDLPQPPSLAKPGPGEPKAHPPAEVKPPEQAKDKSPPPAKPTEPAGPKPATPKPTAQPPNPPHKASQPKRVPPPPEYQPEDFPECEKYADGIYTMLMLGQRPLDVFMSPTMQATNTTLERVKDYCAALVRQIHPPGQVRPNLFKVVPTDYVWAADMPIWSISDEDFWTLEDMTQGTLILGATGSGKSTCSGRAIAEALLGKQFGGLILTTKPGEGREWKIFCNAMGREMDVRYVRIDGLLRMNLLAYETQRPGAGAQLTENLIGFFRVLLSVLGYRHGQQTNEGFWRNAGNQLLRNLFEVFLIAQAPLTLDRLAEFIAAAPVLESDDEDAWRDVPMFGEILAAAEGNATSAADQRTFAKAKAYWLHEYPSPRMPKETRGSILATVNAMLDVMRSRQIYELLSTETTIVPECVFSGHIIILDLPIKEFGDAGLLVQAAFKYLFQRAVERRQDLGDQTRPVFLFIDEAQTFFTEYDAVFQQTARSSRVATILLSQNVNNFYSHLGGDNNARHLFDSLAGNLNTRIFHANGDLLTNEWASKMFGMWDRPVTSMSASTPHHQSLNPFDSVPPTFGTGVTTRREPMVPPEDFAKLRSCNSRSNYESEAYVYRVGSLFQSTGQSYVKTVFGQTRIEEKIEPPKGA